MHLWKLILSYDGTRFHGWQIQPHLPTVQGALAAALRRLTGEAVLPQGSGRTDAGVHALAQVASFPLGSPIPAPNLVRALNRILPGSIRVLSAEIVEPNFHARHSAVRKTYEYRIFPSALHPPSRDTPPMPLPIIPRICPPTLAPYVWDFRLPLDLSRLNQAAAHVVGLHDFTSFAATDPDLALRSDDPLSPHPPSACRRFDASSWSWDTGLLVYRVTGSGFLHHMVRNLVGTFLQAGAGRLSADAIPAILAARSRSAAGPTAPARGLFLVDVEYP